MAKKQLSPTEPVATKSAPARTRSRGAKHTKAAVSSAVPESAILETAAEVLYDHDAIAALAYSYWEARGCQGGSQEEDWLRAEKEFLNERKLAGNL